MFTTKNITHFISNIQYNGFSKVFKEFKQGFIPAHKKALDIINKCSILQV